MFFAFSGSFLQESLAIYQGKQKSTRFHKMVIGTIIGGLIYLIIQNKYFSSLGTTFTTVINVFCGVIGYEIFNKCSSIRSMAELAEDLHKIVFKIFGIDTILKSNKKDKEDLKKK